MEALAKPLPVGANTSIYNSMYFYFGMSLMVAVIVGLVIFLFSSRMNTIPFGSSGNGPTWEGFQGPANGVSTLSCGQESSEAVSLSEMFTKRSSTTEDGSADLLELKQILSKLCCIKHDLMSPTHIVKSTQYLKYATSHDLQSPSDTVARCFTKSIPSRDLDLAFGKWKQRALFLISKLCTSYNFNNEDTQSAIGLFNTLWSDVLAIANNVCLAPTPESGADSVSPRALNGFTPETVKSLVPYTGYY